MPHSETPIQEQPLRTPTRRSEEEAPLTAHPGHWEFLGPCESCPLVKSSDAPRAPLIDSLGPVQLKGFVQKSNSLWSKGTIC